MTFNQVVPGSNPGCLIDEKQPEASKIKGLRLFLIYPMFAMYEVLNVRIAFAEGVF